ncbi:MAG: ABC transporter substrate-binding protein [Lentisphaerae bacterium]|nr:ABC transporter substrate-binding protein [Lentisphaerota bacterium]
MRFTRILPALLVLVLAITAVAAERPVAVRIAYLPITHAYPLYAAQELFGGQFADTRLELVRFGSWVELVEALNAGKVDGASVLFPLAVKARENGIPIRVVALGHRDGNVVVVDPAIKDVAALKGKTVAIPSRISAHYILLDLALKKGGLGLSDVRIVELPPPEMPAALAEKRLSGYVVAEPFGAKAVALGKGRVLYQSEEIWEDSFCCAFTLRAAFIEQQPAQARELTAAYLKAAHALEHEDTAAREAGRKYLKVPEPVLDLSLTWISYADLGVKRPEYERLIGYMRDLTLTVNPPSYEDLIDNRLLEPVPR